MKLPILFALLTGLFWGTYGPTLAQARFFEKSAFKPYVMIGVAYLASIMLVVAVPIEEVEVAVEVVEAMVEVVAAGDQR